jgi:hypothetical protein
MADSGSPRDEVGRAPRAVPRRPTRHPQAAQTRRRLRFLRPVPIAPLPGEPALPSTGGRAVA